MESVEVRRPPLEEQREGWAGRIEVFRCRECSTTTNFPRYNNPSHLLTTKLGKLRYALRMLILISYRAHVASHRAMW